MKLLALKVEEITYPSLSSVKSVPDSSLNLNVKKSLAVIFASEVGFPFEILMNNEALCPIGKREEETVIIGVMSFLLGTAEAEVVIKGDVFTNKKSKQK